MPVLSPLLSRPVQQHRLRGTEGLARQTQPPQIRFRVALSRVRPQAQGHLGRRLLNRGRRVLPWPFRPLERVPRALCS